MRIVKDTNARARINKRRRQKSVARELPEQGSSRGIYVYAFTQLLTFQSQISYGPAEWGPVTTRRGRGPKVLTTQKRRRER